MNTLKTILQDFKSIPSSVKSLTLIVSIWIFGWGFIDPLFSLYLKSITPNYALIGIFASVASLTAILFVVPVGDIGDHIDSKIILKYGFLGYILSGILYFLAGKFTLLPLLIAGLVVNGALRPVVHVSARTYIKKKSPTKKASTFIGFYCMTFFFFYAMGMLL